MLVVFEEIKMSFLGKKKGQLASIFGKTTAARKFG